MSDSTRERFKDCQSFKVWHSEASDEKQLYLKLKQSDDGDIVLQAVDHKGELVRGGNLLIVSDDAGCFIILDGTNPVFPLRTDPVNCTLTYTESQMKTMTGRGGRGLDIGAIVGGSILADILKSVKKDHKDCKESTCKHEKNEH